MASFNQLDHAGIVQGGARVAPLSGDVSQRQQHIDFSQCQRCLAYALGFCGNGSTQLGKQAALDLDNFFLRIQHLGFAANLISEAEMLVAFDEAERFHPLRLHHKLPPGMPGAI